MTPISVGVSASTSSAAQAGDIGGITVYGGGGSGSGSGGLLGAVTGSGGLLGGALGSGTKPWYLYLLVGAVALFGLFIIVKFWRRK